MPDESAPTELPGIDGFVRGYETEGQLRGRRCPRCGFVTASWGVACLRCGSGDLEAVVLGSSGRVRAFTLVEVPTEEMVNDAPYAYVLVDLDGGGTISGWMPTVRSADDLRPGQRVRLARSYRPGVQFEREPPQDERREAA